MKLEHNMAQPAKQGVMKVHMLSDHIEKCGQPHVE
jgi:hypothetical protein